MGCHMQTHTHTCSPRPSMSSSPAFADKYMCVCKSDRCSRPQFHSWQRGETQVCQCGQVRGPSLPTRSSVQVLPDLSSSCPPLFLTSPSCLLVTFWHVLLSVSLFHPDTGPRPCCLPTQTAVRADGKLAKA